MLYVKYAREGKQKRETDSNFYQLFDLFVFLIMLSQFYLQNRENKEKNVRKVEIQLYCTNVKKIS